MCGKTQIFFTFLNIIFLGTCADDILVEIQNGVIRGREDISPHYTTYYAFERIPYATPPVGPLRFKPPQPVQNWDGVLDATKYDVVCVQFLYYLSEHPEMENEDCLYLNVYTPQLPGTNITNLLPVMVYIYGGGLFSGDTFLYGPQYLIEHEVIVVTFNYRLGPLGFLSTQDKVLPGNMGLKDQVLAIQWVQDNIVAFQGDPDKVTIFGESSGGVSVGLHLLHPKSQGLFRAAISQSGCGLSPQGYQRKAREIAFKTAGLIDEGFYSKNDSQELLEYLRGVDVADLKKAGMNMIASETLETKQVFNGLYYGPVFEYEHEGAFLTEKNYVALKNGDVVKVPLIIGFTSEEVVEMGNDIEVLKNMAQQYDNNLELLVNADMRIQNIDTKKEMGSKIRQIYVGNSTFSQNLGGAIKFDSDNSVTRPAMKFAQLYSKHANVYFYQFSYDGLLGNISLPPIEGIERVGHAEDIVYIFYVDSEKFNSTDLSKFPSEDQLTQKRMLKIWTDFAKTANPTPESSELLQNLTWPVVNEVQEDGLLYVDINSDLTIGMAPKKERFEKWNELYASLGYDDFDTY